MIRKLIPVFLVFLLISSFLMAVDSPEKFLGFKVGADGKLVHYNMIKKYFVEVDQQSPRVVTKFIGKTTLKNDMVMAIISSEENIKNLDKYKEISKKLSLAEVGTKEAKDLAAKGKIVVLVTCSLHASEIGSSQMAVELLHRLATENTPQTNLILDNVIFILVPSANPDGQIMIVDWYNKYKGTQYEGGSMPYLYHWYAGHDNNRDWFKINLKETWNVTKLMYHDWFPQVHIDEHQMGSSGDRFFVPPFADPPSPGVHPLVWRLLNLYGTRIALDLERLDYSGIGSRGYFMGWWIGAMDDTAWFHNIPGILFEAASVRIASPIYIEPEEVRSPVSRDNEERMFSPNPWKGGWWRLRDIVNYDLHGTLSVLKTAAMNREEFLLNSYKMATDNINRGKNESPFAYIVPKNQLDPITGEKFIQTLLKASLKVFRLNKALSIGNYYFEAGSFVVPLAQPYRSYVKSIFERQHYPDLRRSDKDSRIMPYDGAGWTLHLGMGVKAKEIKKPFKADMQPVNLEDIYLFKLPEENNKETYIVLDSKYNNSFLAASVLLKRGVNVWRNYDSQDISKGSFVVKSAEAWKILKEINKTTPLIVDNKNNLSLSTYKKLKNIKVALYQNWGGNMTEGWTRFVFDEFKVNYETLQPKDFSKKNFLKKYDVIVFVGASKSQIESGKPPKRWERWFSPLPPEYTGGIGSKGKKALEEFIKSGKTLIFMGRSCEYAIDTLKLPTENVIGQGSKVICPGSYLKAEVKETELTFGMGPLVAVYYSRDPVFRTSLPRTVSKKRRTHLTFGTRDFLLSGLLEGEEVLKRKSLVVDFTIDSGKIVLIGPDMIHRATTEGTYKIMFNSIFTAAK